MFQSKRVFWQYELEGEMDLEKEVDKMIRQTADEYQEQAETTSKVVKTVQIESWKRNPTNNHIT